MKYAPNNTLLTVEIDSLLEVIENCEQSRDFGASIVAFEPVWDDIELEPDFSGFSLIHQAELYRRAGYFLSHFGQSKSKKHYQERAKDLLTKAISIYESLSNFPMVAESQNALGLCYFYQGAFSESEAILEQTAFDFLTDRLNLIYLQNRGNLLLAKYWQKKYDEAFEIIDEIEVPMEFCDDKKTCFVFHEKVGLVCRATNQFDRAIHHYNLAIDFAKDLNNLTFLSSAINNLAFLYNKTNSFDLAVEKINEAIQIVQHIKQTGWLANFLDTKATIYSNQGYFNLAIETIDEAINILDSGDDARGLTEALWNKCKFLLALERKEEAITLFGERLIPTASRQMGEFAVKLFVKEFSQMIHIKRNGTFEEEIQRFKRVEIVNAIREAKYSLYDAADLLKIEPSQLIKMIDREFPELYQELDILHLNELDEHLGRNADRSLSCPRTISEIDLKETEIIFETEAPKTCKTFYFNAQKMLDSFGISEDSVVAILPIQEISDNDFVLVEDSAKNIYSFGKVNYDKALDLYFFVSEDEPMPISFDDVTLVGKAIGYCSIVETDSNKVFFRNL